VLEGVTVKDGEIDVGGRKRPMTEDKFAQIKDALRHIDHDGQGGRWTGAAVTWAAVQKAAAVSLLVPSTINQGETAICGATALIETMCDLRPHLFAQLVDAVWRGEVTDAQGKHWGSIHAGLLASDPPASVPTLSLTSWMIGTAVTAEDRERSFWRRMLGDDELTGQDAFGPDASLEEMRRGMTTPWEEAKMMREILGCTSIHREQSYWEANPEQIRRCLEHSSTGQLSRGEVVAIFLIDPNGWNKALHEDLAKEAKGSFKPGHFVRLESAKRLEDGDLQITVFTFGVLSVRKLSDEAFSRFVFEVIFGGW